jgi:tRNA 2-thiouridine synthesizing protein A
VANFGIATLVSIDNRGPNMTDHRLDLRGLKCPLPALHTRRRLAGLEAGDRLVVECTDPLSRIDIPNMLRETGDVLEQVNEKAGVIVFSLRRAT